MRALSKAGPIGKSLLGVAVLAVLAFSGKLNLAAVGKSLAHWPTMAAMLALGYAQVTTCVFRWKRLLQAQKIHLSFRQVWSLAMIGMLFNVVIPGAVGGDLIKSYYMIRAAPDRAGHAATTILMDRVTGMIGLLFLGAVVSLASWQEIQQHAAARNLALLNIAAAMGAMAALYAAVFTGNWFARPFLPRAVRDAFLALHEYRREQRAVWVALALSVLNQMMSCTLFYLAFLTTGIRGAPLGRILLAVPLGFVANALPISPGGVGVGQAAFFGLFRIIAPQYASVAADSVTVIQVILIAMSISGLYWYLSYKKLDLHAAAPNRGTEPGTAARAEYAD